MLLPKFVDFAYLACINDQTIVVGSNSNLVRVVEFVIILLVSFLPLNSEKI